MKKYSDVQGDGGSGIVEQLVQQKNQIDERLRSVKHLLAVGSGKGGVGKSTLTMQLALAFAAEGKRVAVLDADFNGPSIARLAGAKDVLALPGPNGLCLPKTSDGIGVVSTGSFLADDTALTFDSVSRGETFVWRATREFSALANLLIGTDWGELDFLLIDLPPGPERTFQFVEFFGERLNVLLVTIPSDLSYEVVARSISAIENASAPALGVVENMSGYLAPNSDELLPLFPSSSKTSMSLELITKLPFEPELASLCDRGLDIETWKSLRSSSKIIELSLEIFEKIGVE